MVLPRIAALSPRGLPWLVLALMLGVTWAFCAKEARDSARELREHLDFSLANTVARIQQRCSDAEQILRGVRGLAAAGAGTAPKAFQAYAESLHLDSGSSPITALGLLSWTPATAGDETGGSAAIVARAPGGETRAIGFDAWADPQRRQALARARDTGMVAIAGGVRLADDPNVRAPYAFVMYLPLYAEGKPTTSSAERRAALVGWASAVFHMRSLMQSLYGEEGRELRVAVYEGIGLDGGKLLYDSAPAVDADAMPTMHEYVEIGGHAWTVALTGTPAFEAIYSRSAAAPIGIAGIVLAALLSLLTGLLVTGRERALRLAERMTERLREAERRQLLNEERQRLMRDMHDGLGSSLVGALRAVEHGRIEAGEVAQLLRSCIDDMKLTIDSLDPVGADLPQLLAGLRFRLEPRLEGAGVTLLWKIEDVPPIEWLTPGDALNILRIVQEVFTNVIKHTGAHTIRVATATADGGVSVFIDDNGGGFDLNRALHDGGRGLPNIMRRAEAIGGRVDWRSDATGTHFSLWLPLCRPARNAGDTGPTVTRCG